MKTRPEAKSGVLTTRLHGILDYLAGTLLLISTWILPYPDDVMRNLALILGGGIVLYSLVTDYPLSLLRFIPFPFHRAADLLVGVLLLFAPIHFAVHGAPAVLFVACGLILLSVSFFTRAQERPRVSDN